VTLFTKLLWVLIVLFVILLTFYLTSGIHLLQEVSLLSRAAGF